MDEKTHSAQVGNVEDTAKSGDNEAVDDAQENLVYDNPDEEPELHTRTIVACMAMFLLNLVQVFALQGPPAVVSPSI